MLRFVVTIELRCSCSVPPKSAKEDLKYLESGCRLHDDVMRGRSATGLRRGPMSLTAVTWGCRVKVSMCCGFFQTLTVIRAALIPTCAPIPRDSMHHQHVCLLQGPREGLGEGFKECA